MKSKKTLSDLKGLLRESQTPSSPPAEVPEIAYIRVGSVLYQVNDCIDVKSVHNGQTRKILTTREGRSFFVCEEGKRWNRASIGEWNEFQSRISFSQEMSAKAVIHGAGSLSGSGAGNAGGAEADSSDGGFGGSWSDKGYF